MPILYLSQVLQGAALIYDATSGTVETQVVATSHFSTHFVTVETSFSMVMPFVMPQHSRRHWWCGAQQVDIDCLEGEARSQQVDVDWLEGEACLQQVDVDWLEG